MGFFLFFVEMGGARVLDSLDSWSLPGHAGIRHFALTYIVFEI